MKKLIAIFFALATTVLAQNSYKEKVKKIQETKTIFKIKKISIDSCRNYLLTSFYNDIYPQWIGTTWDYNGYSNTPKKGEIACGYFVSTPLKHMGFNWNRYKLAQMYSKQIIEKTCDQIAVFQSKKKLINHMHNQNDGIYIIGLSNHVGFIVKIDNESFFIHSNYINYQGPCKEKLTNSEALNASNVFWVGRFLNPKNIKKWLDNTSYAF